MKHPVMAGLGLVLGVATGIFLLEHDEEIPMDDVPAVVLAAAQGAVQGVEFTEAEIEGDLYELEGEIDGREVEVRVTPEGRVVDVEWES